MRQRMLLVAPVIAFAAGCLPPRDNPIDPNNAPRVTLVAIDRTLVSGACPQEAGDGFDGPAVVTASRGRCLGLDAGVFDKDGDPLDEVTVEFSVVNSGATLELVDGIDGTLVPPARFVLGEARRRSLVVNDELVQFRATAHASGGKTTATLDFLLTNAPPLAVGNAPRALTVSPNASATQQVVFDGSRSVDPDGDLLQFEWIFDAHLPPETSALSTAPQVRDVPVGAPRRFLSHLRAWDGNAYSEYTTVEVAVGKGVIWSKGNSVAPWARVDTERLALDLPGGGTTSRSLALGLAGDDVVATWAVETTSGALDFLSVYDRHGAALTAPVPVPDQVETIAGAGPSTAWVGYRMDTQTNVAKWNLTGTPSETLVRDVAPMFSATEGDYEIVSGMAGDAWVSGSFGSNIAHIDTDGFVTRVLDTSGRWVTAMAMRPPGTELWTVETPDLFAGVSGTSSIVKRTTAGVVDRFDLGDHFAMGLAWADAERFWVFISGIGLSLVDATLLEAVPELPVEAAVIFAFESEGFAQLASDPNTGACWARDFVGDYFLATTDGRIASLGAAEQRIVSFIDPDGLAWYPTPDGLFRGLGIDRQGFVGRLEVGSEIGRPDPHEGGLWVTGVLPPSLQYFAVNGVLDRVVSKVLIDGEESHLPFFETIHIAHDGRAFWGIPSQELGSPRPILYLDLGTDPPAGRHLLTIDEADEVENNGSLIPVFGETKAWIALTVTSSGNSVPEISVLDSSGNVSPVFVVPSTGYKSKFVSSPASDELCIPTLALYGSAGTPSFLVHSVDASSQTSRTWTIDYGDGSDFDGVDATWDETDGLVCWVMFGETTGNCDDPNPDGSTALIGVRMSDGAIHRLYESATFGGNGMIMQSSTAAILNGRTCEIPGAGGEYFLRLDLSSPLAAREELVGPITTATQFSNPRR